MRIFISLSGKEQIVKGSRIAVRQGKDYWVATVTRRSSDGTVSLQYDEGTKDSGVSLRTITHLPDSAKIFKRALTKEQVQVIVEKGKAAEAKLKAAAEKARPVQKTATKIVKVPLKTVVKTAIKTKTPVSTKVKTVTMPEVKVKETLSDLHSQLRQLEDDERSDRRRGQISDDRKVFYDNAYKLLRSKIKKLMPEREVEDNELADPRKPIGANQPVTEVNPKAKFNLAVFSPAAMHNRPDLGDLSFIEPRDIKPEINKVLEAMGFRNARYMVAEKSKFSVNPLSMAVNTDFAMGQDRMKKQKDTASETVMHEAEKAGLKAERTNSGFRLTSKLGPIDFTVRHIPFAKGNRGLLIITPV